MEIGTQISIYGAVTGSIGTILAVLNHISIRKIRHEDFAIKYQIQSNKTKAICQHLPSFSLQAEHSRQAILLATGAMGGGFERWKQERIADMRRLEEIHNEIDNLDNFSQTNTKISSAIIRVDRLFDEANSIQRKYEKSIDEDQQKIKARQANRI